MFLTKIFYQYACMAYLLPNATLIRNNRGLIAIEDFAGAKINSSLQERHLEISM